MLTAPADACEHQETTERQCFPSAEDRLLEGPRLKRAWVAMAILFTRPQADVPTTGGRGSSFDFLRAGFVDAQEPQAEEWKPLALAVAEFEAATPARFRAHAGPRAMQYVPPPQRDPREKPKARAPSLPLDRHRAKTLPLLWRVLPHAPGSTSCEIESVGCRRRRCFNHKGDAACDGGFP